MKIIDKTPMFVFNLNRRGKRTPDYKRVFLLGGLALIFHFLYNINGI